MHWIMVGILIWIGLAIAPAVIGLILVSLPFLIGGAIGAAIGLTMTQSTAGLIIGLLIGGIVPYFIFFRE
jgi:hypothetical protein